MERRLGDRSPRIREAAALLTAKGIHGSPHYLFEGPTLLREAVRSGVRPHEIYATQPAFDNEPLLAELREQGVPIFIVSERAGKRLSAVRTPQGIYALATTALCQLDSMLARPGAAIVLAGLSDPGNAGTLVRCADAFGGCAIFAPGAVGPYHPKVIRAAMGSFFRVPIAVATSAAIVQAASLAGRPIVGLDASGGSRLEDMPAKAVIVVGRERQGLGEWKPICERLFTIPMAAGAESLNAAVAGAIALYEASRRARELPAK
ncbi:MAG: TrmH family RNA methyltransferase [Candidatus Tyrphobacter sp.]